MTFGEIAIFVLIAVAVIALTALIFGGWLLVTVVRLISRGIASLLGVPNYARRPLTSKAMSRCPRARCHAENHPSARFCRRCGVDMQSQGERTHVRVRRAAML